MNLFKIKQKTKQNKISFHRFSGSIVQSGIENDKIIKAIHYFIKGPE